MLMAKSKRRREIRSGPAGAKMPSKKLEGDPENEG